MDIWLSLPGSVRVHPHRRTCESPIDVLLAQSHERHTLQNLAQYSSPSPHCKIAILILTLLLEEEVLQSHTIVKVNGEALH